MTNTDLSETVNSDVLRDMLAQGRPVTILDVRPEEEWAEWRIPGSVHVDAYAALKAGDPDALSGVDLPINTPVVTLCGAGFTSLTAARQLRQRGYQAHSLAGGMKAWSLAWNSADVPLRTSNAQVIQMRRTGKGCLSYLIGSGDEALVIDASLQPDVYVTMARQHGWRITKVMDTHIHADHLSRSRLLASASGATLHLPAQERVSYPFSAVDDGDVLTMGSVLVRAIRTPGHTLESTCYLINDEILITGDTLFLDAVGRPDLKADLKQTRRRAHLLYRSLNRLLALPAGTLILPGHASQPVAFDGRALAAPLAQVRQQIPLLSLAEDDFVDTLLLRIPDTPPNHIRIVELNEAGAMPDSDLTDLEAGANRCAAG